MRKAQAVILHLEVTEVGPPHPTGLPGLRSLLQSSDYCLYLNPLTAVLQAEFL